MKKVIGNGVLILILVAIGYMIYLTECKRTEDCPPEGYILVSQVDWDSVMAVANEPPDTFVNVVVVPGDLVYLPSKPIPIPVEIGKDTNMYSDSIVNDSINVWVDVMVEGLLLSWDWKYNPITKKVETIIEKKVPVPVPVEVPVYKRELFLSGVVGGNMNAFSFGADLDLVNKKRNIYGLQYRRVGSDNFVYFKIGTKIKLF